MSYDIIKITLSPNSYRAAAELQNSNIIYYSLINLINFNIFVYRVLLCLLECFSFFSKILLLSSAQDSSDSFDYYIFLSLNSNLKDYI